MPATAGLPLGLKCDPTVKIAGAEIGEVGKYSVQMGMKKEEHSALLHRKKRGFAVPVARALSGYPILPPLFPPHEHTCRVGLEISSPCVP